MDPIKVAENVDKFTNSQILIVVLLLILALLIYLLKYTYDKMIKMKDDQITEQNKEMKQEIKSLRDDLSDLEIRFSELCGMHKINHRKN